MKTEELIDPLLRHQSWEDDLENGTFEHSIGTPTSDSISGDEDELLDTSNRLQKRLRSLTYYGDHDLEPNDELSKPSDHSNSIIISHSHSNHPSDNLTSIELSNSPSSTDTPVKRKRGRPPGKKISKMNGSETFDNPMSIIGNDHSYSNPLYPSGSPLNSPIPGISGSISTPIKRGRGRPRKNPLLSTPIIGRSFDAHSTQNFLNTKMMPSDFEICSFVKNLIVESHRIEPDRDDAMTILDNISIESDPDTHPTISKDDSNATHATTDLHVAEPNAASSQLDSIASSHIVISYTNESFFNSGPSSPTPGSSPLSNASDGFFLSPSSVSRPSSPSSNSIASKETLTPDLALKKLEGHFGVNLSCRKHFLYEVFNVLWA